MAASLVAHISGHVTQLLMAGHVGGDPLPVRVDEGTCDTLLAVAESIASVHAMLPVSRLLSDGTMTDTTGVPALEDPSVKSGL